MFYIAFTLFGAWVLSLFGFDSVVQTGMKELFDITISITTYYFIFGTLGALKNLLFMVNPNFKGIQYKKPEAKVVLENPKK